MHLDRAGRQWAAPLFVALPPWRPAGRNTLSATARRVPTYTTSDVVLIVGTSYGRIIAAIRGGKLSPPQLNGSGRWAWTDADVAALRKALATDRRRKEHRGAANA